MFVRCGAIAKMPGGQTIVHFAWLGRRAFTILAAMLRLGLSTSSGLFPFAAVAEIGPSAVHFTCRD